VVPINHTYLRPLAPKRSRLREARYGGRRKVGGQGPRLRWVIRRERNPPKHGRIVRVSFPVQSYAFLLPVEPGGFLRRRMKLPSREAPPCRAESFT